MSHDHSMTIYSREGPACDVASLAPCSYEEADTIMFAHAAGAAKRACKKISSHTVDTDVGVLANTCGASAGIR